ncbi:MAG: M20/M25/M40 family metallo-hydrolase [Desulfobulbaceae bacterium]|nr:M20/M25/M40 family metallo-hydrolase [Desulfobulbaceae bacterium]
MTPPLVINRERLAACFVLLCETDSPSREEGKIAALLKGIFSDLGADEILEDDSARVTGSDSGNLFIRFRGTAEAEGIFFCCHMDTVEPARGVKVRRQNDTFFSAGDTVLGSDDKSGVAAIIETIRYLRENNVPHGPIEIVLTTCEEIGLLGAKSLDPAMINAKIGYALDSTGIDTVIIGAPAANHLEITVEGVAAHAGLHPEWGINAITLAARALADIPQGRIGDQSTINIGTIEGGVASNIVPERVTVVGEIRSHSEEYLQQLTDEVQRVFERVVQEWDDPSGQARGEPGLSFTARPEFPVMKLDRADKVIRHIGKAARSIGLGLSYKIAGGGSDANILNGYGLPTAIIATGMNHVHSTDEQVKLGDMEKLTRLLIALATAWCGIWDRKGKSV